MNHREITDHSLHLLVDDQLDPLSRKKLLDQVAESPELQQKLKNIHEVRELLALAYIQEKPRGEQSTPENVKPYSWFMGSLAASFVLVVGLTLGWFGHDLLITDPSLQTVETVAGRMEEAPILPPVELMQRKYMMHFDAMNEPRLQQALVETESIIHSYAQSSLPVKIDLLFDQQAVNFFSADHQLQVQQLGLFVNQHKNVQVYVCSESLQMYLKESEISSDIQQFQTDEVVKDIIPERIKQGWVQLRTS